MSLPALFVANLLGGVAAVLMGVTLLGVSYVVAHGLLPAAPVSVRACGTAVAGLWLAAALFWALAAVGGFRSWIALVVWAGVGLLVVRTSKGRRSWWRALVRDADRAKRWTRSVLRGFAGWAFLVTVAMAVVRLLRGFVSPPLGWDALTYHLFKAGRWVQAGGLVEGSGPDAWQYYEYYPVTGDAYWAWAMLPTRTDALLALAGFAVWGTALLAVYTASRLLGARRDHALLAAAALGALPSALAYLSSGYVDNTVMALFALGSVFVVRLWTSGEAVSAPIAIAALSLMLGTKLTTAAFFAVGGVLVVVGVLRARIPRRGKALLLAGCVALGLAGAPSYVEAWVERGSPFYPFPISFGGHVLSEGYEGSAEVKEAMRTSEGWRLDSKWEFWRLFLSLPKDSGSFVNPGPGSPVLALLALLGALHLVRSPGRRVAGAFMLACAVLMVLGFLSANMATFRTTVKVTTAGRYVLVGFAAAAILGAAWPGRIAKPLWITAVLAGLACSFPRGWSPVEAAPLLWVSGLAAAAGTAMVLISIWMQRERRLLAPSLLAVALLALSTATLERIRSEYRYPLYAAAADPVAPLFHMHNLHPLYASAWPIWKALDAPGEPYRIAATAGWDGLGHNWYRYPLLGSRLQNRVLYVPVTADGGIVDYREREEVARRASFTAWLGRLVEARIDFVVSLAPRTTIEDHWMRQAPELFEPAVSDPRGLHVAYRLHRDAALAALATTPSTRSRAPPPPRAPGSPGRGGP